MIPFSQYTHGGGGVWVAEISYDLHGSRETGYLVADIWIESDPELLLNDTLFQSELLSRYVPSDTLVIYRQLIDQEFLAGIALFPMHPFTLNTFTASRVCVDDIHSVSMNKVWKRIDYGIRVLSDISLSDSSWIADRSILEPVIHPVGDDAGCRLEVYDFNPVYDPTEEIEVLSHLYRPYRLLDKDLAKRCQDTIYRLKQKRIVVVELCGC